MSTVFYPYTRSTTQRGNDMTDVGFTAITKSYDLEISLRKPEHRVPALEDKGVRNEGFP